MGPAFRLVLSVLVAGAVSGLVVSASAQQPAASAKAPPAAKAKAAVAKSKKGGGSALPKPSTDPAEAQSQVEAGVAALGQGRNDAAVASLTSAISAGSLPSAQSARALYYRGVAHRRQAKPAQAISDLTSALWIKNGLTEEQRADALQQRSGAYREAGLPDQSAPGAAQPRTASKAAAGPAATAVVAPSAPGSNSVSIGSSSGSLFGGLFGGGASQPAAAQARSAPVAAAATTGSVTTAAVPVARAAAPAGGGEQTAPALVRRERPSVPIGFQSEVPDPPYVGPSRSSTGATVAATVPAQPSGAVAKAWGDATEVKPAKRAAAKAAEPVGAPVKAASAAKAEAAPKRGAAKGGASANIQIQVAAVRSAKEAEGVAARLKSQYGRDLAGRTPVVDQTAMGQLGLLYRVQVGPFASLGETQTLCARLKSDGLDCRLVSQ